ncbi:ribosomal protein S18-alanine N-acetyltransferase [Marinobacter lacisalsi]|uniref:[Ribosomal protein bS18]-alanine N-acetyltransferase n=1 Tax=Marinobacter lacisalsi TaxID=475979 RepID=A0ABV8QI37_9GAMM
MSSGPHDILHRVVEMGQGLRALAEPDIPEILEIERLGYSHPWSEGVFRDSFRSEYTVLGVEQCGQMAGYGVLAALYDEAHLLNLCLRPASRGRGLARQLLRALLRAAVMQGMHRVVLEVRASNHVARKLYESEGFAVVGERPGYYPDGATREDALVMILEFGATGPDP